MTRRYGEVITVTRRGDLPVSFVWRERRYEVSVIASWRLATRWWDTARAARRHYYRLMTPDLAVFEVYHEQVSDIWVLDSLLD